MSYDNGQIQIRMYRLEDAAVATEAISESYEHLRPWMPWARPDQTQEHTEAFLRQAIANHLLGTDFTLSVWDGEEFIGATGFHLRVGPIEWKCAEIGMWIASRHAGKGLGTLALQAMLEWGFGEWGWERLIWKCDSKNLASARTAEKAGMTREATFRSDALGVDGNRRNTHQYALLKTEFLAKFLSQTRQESER